MPLTWNCTAPSSHCEMAIEELIPSPEYRILVRVIEVMMRRPYAISTGGTPETCDTSTAPAASAAARPAAPYTVRAALTSGARISTAPIAASTISTRSQPCVPIHGTRTRLKLSAPAIAPPVLAA